MSPDTEPLHDLDEADDADDPDERDAPGEGDITAERDVLTEREVPAEPKDEEPADEPFVPLGSEESAEDAADENLDAHAAIARSLQPPPALTRALHKEARSFFDGAMYAYTDGDLRGARLSFLAVAGIGDPDTAPAALVFLGVIASRNRDFPEARMWFARAAAGPDKHWALVAAQELRRVG